jgi:hypothetical protein
MPIRLNLLAEAKAAEESRRRDPLKRALVAAALSIALMLVWSSSLFLKGVLANSELSRMQGQMSGRTNLYQSVINNQKKMEDIRRNLTALSQLSSNRFLSATLLNALQQSTVEDVQLIRLKAEQTYVLAEATKPTTNGDRILPSKPATETEKILITLEGNDFSRNAGDQVSRFKQTLAANPYFREMLAKTNAVNLKKLEPPQVSVATGKPFVLFALECRYPEKTR